MEKTPMYSVMSPAPHTCRRLWVSWVAAAMGLVALVVACVTTGVCIRQADTATMTEARLVMLEEKMMMLEEHMEEVLRFTLSSHDYFEYDDQEEDDMRFREDDTNNAQFSPYEELTVQRVVRKRRQAGGADPAAVPIYDQAYGVNLSKGRPPSEGLRLYESLQATRGEGDPMSPEVTIEATESPIKPHHRVSSLWVPKKRRQRHPPSSGPKLSSRAYVRQDDDDDDDEGDDANQLGVIHQNRRHGSVMERRSRVKATERHEGSPARNSVVPQSGSVIASVSQPTAAERVEQQPEYLKHRVLSPVIGQEHIRGKKRKLRKKPGRRNRRRLRSAITVAHFLARNASFPGDSTYDEKWEPAAWMNKLGLNQKYELSRGAVTVKEAGLYLIYAQVLYESQRFSTGYQVVVDGIPVMECSLTPSQPTSSCHTSGATYLPRNAQVYLRDREHHTRMVRRQENTFFGLLKLMDAPANAEQLLLG